VGRTFFIPGFCVLLLQRNSFGVSMPIHAQGYTASATVTGNVSAFGVGGSGRGRPGKPSRLAAMCSFFSK
jgi:hypothetical protein